MAGIDVDEDVLRRVRRLESDEWHIDLRLSSPLGREALVGAFAAVMDRLEEEDWPGLEEDPGGWCWHRAGDDVLIQVDEPEDFEAELAMVLDGLRARGVTGRLRAIDGEPPIAGFAGAHFIAAQLRVRGHREGTRWKAHRGLFDEVSAAVGRWSVRDTGCSHVRVQFGAMPAVNVEVEDLEAHLADTLGRRDHVSASCAVVTRECLRAVVLHPDGGVISLSTGPRPESELRWKPAVAGVTALLREVAGGVAYALVRRGAKRDSLGTESYCDWAQEWPPRTWLGVPDPERDSAEKAYEDRFAPDAFGVQLLGPGYGSRLPAAPSFRRTTIGDATLLEHADPRAWFAAPIIAADPDDWRAPQTPPPPILAAARAELEPILMRPDLVAPD